MSTAIILTQCNFEDRMTPRSSVELLPLGILLAAPGDRRFAGRPGLQPEHGHQRPGVK